MKKGKLKKIIGIIIVILAVLYGVIDLDVAPDVNDDPQSGDPGQEQQVIDKDGYYYSKDDVSLYLQTYGVLPSNYITKSEAKKLGWQGGKVEPYAKGMVIGGDTFNNAEKLLPTDRKYKECDIDTRNKERGSKRIVFTSDKKDLLIYYTSDHYESFSLLYGKP